jgi:hypothetical protein
MPFMRHPALPATLLVFMMAALVFMLNTTPIVWIDEVMFVDIGRNIAQGNGMSSRLWNFEGTETIVLAHMPLWQLFLGATYFFLPDTVFMSRLPGFIVFLCTACFALFYFKQKTQSLYLALLFTLLLAGDKAVFEAARSMRMDILGAALFMALAALKYTRLYPVLAAFLTGALVLVHPVFWIAAAFFFADIWAHQKYNWKYLFLPLIPIVTFFIYIGPHIHLLPAQLFANGGDHTALVYDNFFQRVSSFLYTRYFAWYELQQLTPLLLILSLVAGILLFVSKKEIRFWTLLMWAQFLFLLFAVGDFPRYNLPLTLSVWCASPLFLAYLFPDSQVRKWHLWARQFIIFGVLSLAMYPCVTRLVSTWAQYEERKPDTVLAWIENTLPQQEKVLLVDEAIGFYHSNPLHDFTLVHSMDKFHFGDYPGGVFWLCYQPDSEMKEQPMSEYSVGSGYDLKFLPKAISYNGLKLYRIQTAAQYESIAAMFRNS